MVKSFQEPAPGFQALLSQWEDDDKKSQGHKPALFMSVRRSRKEAMETAKRADSASKKRLPLKNVYQRPLPKAKSFSPPVYQHSSEEKTTILSALKQNFVFSDLSEPKLNPLVSAFETVSYTAGTVIIKQGDPGDYFYVLASGKVEFAVNGVLVGEADTEGSEEIYSFGELALLYTCPRAATVTAVAVETNLFRVDQQSFRSILQEQAVKWEAEKCKLLKGLSIFDYLTVTDFQKLSAAMTPRVFDTSCFDNWSDLEDKTKQSFTPPQKQDAALFEGF